MVVEREPPKVPVSPMKTSRESQEVVAPVFGKSSQLQSPLKNTQNIFNIPKANRPRPEHHRPDAFKTYEPSSQKLGKEESFVDPFAFRDSRPKQEPLPVGFKAAPAPVIHSTYRPPPPTFSSLEGSSSSFRPVNQETRDFQTQGLHDVDAALFADKFYDFNEPLEYVDPAKAAKDMKALLEGAFDDDDDGKPKTRSRRRKVRKSTDELADGTKREKAEGAKAEEQDEDEDEEEIDDGTREGLKVKLLPHQIDGVEWMLAKEKGKTKFKGYVTKGGILADDMGLGKTIQTISTILLNPRPKGEASKLSSKVAKTTLVVAPLALIKQWERELEDKVEDTHTLRVLVHHGPKRTKRGDDLRKYDLVITTYQTVMSEYEASSDKPEGPKVGCFGVHWYRVVLDEAHSIKNRNAKSTKACYALQAEFRWCLTGTPMQNHLDELQSLMHFLKIRPMDNRAVWKEHIITPMSNGKGALAIRRLQAILKSFMKRRTKDVLREQNGLGQNAEGFKLVGRKVEVIKAQFTEKEKEYYKGLEQRTDSSLERMMDSSGLSYASALALLLRLRQACNHKELIKKSLTKDVDALTVKEPTRSQSSQKQKASTQDVDDVADLLGGLTVDAKQCNICLVELADQEISARMVRCTDCEAALVDDEEDRPKIKRSKKKKKDRTSIKPKKEPTPRKHKTRRIVDSDDEDEGEWIVPEKNRLVADMGKAGGIDDENAEGGGDWVGSDDSETDDESSVKVLSQKKKVITLDTTDEDTNQSSDEGSDEESEDESEDHDSDDSSGNENTHVVVSTKIRELMKILHREASSNKFIVYSQFTSMLDLVEPFMKAEGFQYCRYDGKMRNDLREASLEKLRSDKRTRVLLCSLKCGSLGLNLTAASRVVILEPFWNPFVEEQAIDRVHRLNQTVDVIVYRLTIEETVEQRIFDLQEQKRALAEAAIEGKAIAKLSMNDMLNLFKHDAEHKYKDDSKDPTSRTRILANQPQTSTPPVPSPGHGSDSRRVEKPKAFSRPKEDSVYGRRW